MPQHGPADTQDKPIFRDAGNVPASD